MQAPESFVMDNLTKGHVVPSILISSLAASTECDSSSGVTKWNTLTFVFLTAFSGPPFPLPSNTVNSCGVGKVDNIFNFNNALAVMLWPTRIRWCATPYSPLCTRCLMAISGRSGSNSGKTSSPLSTSPILQLYLIRRFQAAFQDFPLKYREGSLHVSTHYHKTKSADKQMLVRLPVQERLPDIFI